MRVKKICHENQQMVCKCLPTEKHRQDLFDLFLEQCVKYQTC